MKKFKWLLCLLLTAVLLTAVPSVRATETTELTQAVSGECGENLTWTLTTDGVLTISGEGKMTNWWSSTDVPWYSYRSSITKVVIGNSVTSIGADAFINCDSLTSVDIGDSVTTIGEWAFYDCNRLTSVEIPDSVTIISVEVFSGCDSLANVDIGDSVTSIGYNAFFQCDNLTSLVIPDSVMSIGNEAFASCDSLTSIVVSSNNQSYCSVEGVLFTRDMTTLIQYPAGSAQTIYTIPDGVTTIGDSGFYGCGKLTSVDIGDSVTSIGKYAFFQCDSLTSLVIPDSVTEIGTEAFGDCDSLTSVDIGDSVTSIGKYAFAYCRSLTRVTIPDSVTTVKDKAFYYCDSLTTVYYTGTEEQWNLITIGDGNDPLLNAEISFVLNLTAPAVTVTLNDSDRPVIIWPAVDGAEKYEVWRAVEGGEFKLLKTMTSRKLTNSSVTPGTTYSYKVRAVSGESYSDFSDIETITVPSALGVPTVTVTLNSSDKPVISWTAVDGAEKYEIWRAVEGGAFKLLKTITGTKITNTSAEAGKTYSYKIRAVAGEDSGDYSAVKTITVPSALGTPTVSVSNKASTGKVIVKWGKVEGAEKYEIWYSTSKSGTYTRLWIGSSTSVTHSSAKAGTIYYYKVRAVADGEYGEFSEIKQRACDCARPTVTITLNSKGKPVISWNAVDGAVKYEIWCSTSENGTYTKLITTTKLKVTHSSSVSGTTYFYKVRAICSVSSGNSAYSTVKSVTVE